MNQAPYLLLVEGCTTVLVDTREEWVSLSVENLGRLHVLGVDFRYNAAVVALHSNLYSGAVAAVGAG